VNLQDRPYLEVEVVKAKKEKKKEEHIGEICIRGKRQPLYLKENRIYYKGTIDKGNWVNDENLDKIKFPCFCRWNDNGWVGMLIKDWKDDEAIYTLVRVDKQTNKNHTYGSFKDLKEFIEKYDIHILKGKIIIFEEE